MLIWRGGHQKVSITVVLQIQSDGHPWPNAVFIWKNSPQNLNQEGQAQSALPPTPSGTAGDMGLNGRILVILNRRTVSWSTSPNVGFYLLEKEISLDEFLFARNCPLIL